MIVLRLALLSAICLPVLVVYAKTIELQPPAPYVTPDEEYRLSTNIDPVNYNITLRPYLLDKYNTKQFTFDGEVYIEIVPQTTTNYVMLHSKNLTYSLREYWPKPTATGQAITKQTLNVLGTRNVDTDISNLTVSGELTANQSYILHFVYTGYMSEDMHGFYRSQYVNDNNETKWLGSTQFQTHHARRAFPCFDEPRFKATFDVNLKRHQTYSTVSNTRQISSTPSDVE